MVTQNGGGVGEIDKQSLKHVLDSIGKKVYREKVQSDAEQYFNELHGSVKDAIFENEPKDPQTPPNPCHLDYRYHTNATRGKNYPCRNGKEERFSEVHGGECDDSKIKGSNGGACAPYRRLHLCVRNLENISALDKINNDTLLVDVCLAALHEGAAISADHGKHQLTNNDSQICTVLARSFADIGDIIRGKDLYRGNNGKDKLENKLKDIFGKIHEDVTNGKNEKKQALQERYKKDKDPNFFQLREDWWYANRKMVWYAITCGAAGGTYFRGTCVGRNSTNEKCRCPSHKVPTYFDYVPQYLRWFEEWGEEFCRLRKHKLQNAIKNCRGEKGNERYCDLNGYNCEETARGAEVFVKGDDCHKCTVPCDNFVHWIDNQKDEFEKQKKKYGNEIKKAEEKKETSKGKINNIYINDFYEILKKYYPTVDDFLEKLSKEKICKDKPHVEKEKADHVDFTERNLNKTFSHTEYCQACPWCGAEPKSDGSGGWKAKNGECTPKNENKLNNGITTPISILFTDRGKTKILEKLGGFCINDENIKKDDWKCHYDNKGTTDVQSDDSNDCVLGDWKNLKKEDKIMPYHPFFWKWVTEMLIDSMYWRKELKSCINNNKNTCRKGCHDKCECYKRWVKQKKEQEWKQMEKHFKTQDFGSPVGLLGQFGYDAVLQQVLDIEDLFQNIKDTYGDVKEIDDIKNMLKEEQKKNKEEDAGVAVTVKRNTIDLLIDHEEKEAEKCVSNNPYKDCPKKPPINPAGNEGVARSGPHDPQLRADPAEDAEGAASDDEEDDDDEDEEDDDPNNIRSIEFEDEKDIVPVFKDDEVPAPEETEVVEETAKKATEVQPPAAPTTQNDVKVCDTVAKIFEDDKSLQAACSLKYGPGGKENFPNWKCIPTKTNEGATAGSSGEATRKRRDTSGVPTTTSSGATAGSGSICIPPRRRRLYIGGLTKLTSDETQSQSLETSGGQKTPSGKESSQSDKLRTAFIQSAAIETFFLWHRYKKIKDIEDIEKRQRETELFVNTSDVGNKLQEELQSGKIPDDFLRQMFYTLGDYRDILVGNTDIVIKGSSGDKDMLQREQNIKEAIEKHFNSENNKPGGTPTVTPTSDEQRKQWWEKYGPEIWEGMICALSYDTNGEKIQMDNEVHKNIMGGDGKIKSKYQYNNIRKDLEDITCTPQFIRWFEEWADEFCRKQTHKLKIIEKDCRGKNGDKNCSGDGFDCDDESPNKDEIFKPFLCSTCAKSCRFYKKWIERKKDEFTEQYNAYGDQKNNYVNECNGSGRNNGDNGFCGTEGKCDTAAAFLNRLKNGPCKNNDDGNNSGENEIDFKKKVSETFKHANNCSTCSEVKKNCQNGHCNNYTEQKCNKTTFKVREAIEKMNKNTDINMFVSDNSGNEFNGLDECKGAGIFKGIRKDVWECGEYCAVHVCTLKKNVNNGQKSDEHITVKELIKRWLETFFEDYNRIQKKLKTCIKKGDENKCINGCVEKWVEEKKEEWDKINDTYIQEYTRNNNVTSNDLNSFLEPLISQIPVVNDKGEHSSLQKLEKSLGCKCAKSSEEKVVKQDKNSDIVDCMLDKLQIKIEKCKKIYHENGDNKCTETSQQTLDLNVETLDDDIETEEAKKMMPTFCNIDEPKEPVVEEKCEASTGKPEGGSDGEKEEEKPKGVEEEEKVPPPPATDTRPAPPSPPLPLPSDEPFNRDILEKTIPFGIAFALGSIAFLFLKKKMKKMKKRKKEYKKKIYYNNKKRDFNNNKN
ncbi:hypothetical protein PFAG_06031 [Plasmodium falciparum Santa Lucia]|uniref:Erythrocyte membrane protein 1 n=1 Tax=Plasmodium falciparum Santa Lucia TaxID=478859 RepID=W7FFV6_PLAFA|nr:hypothetical protein PFAG_06031 [Plasmodium falciparum Santa Lucia]